MGLLAGGVAGALLFGACAWAALLAGARLTGPPARAADRACAAAVVAGWLLIAVFLTLSALHAFRLAVAVPLWAILAALAHRALAPPGGAALLLRDDLARAREGLRVAFRGSLRWIAVPCALLAAAKVARGLVAPPLGWDALTYHLVKAGRWVQEGGLAGFRAPDAWRYYEHFAPHGDILWAWAMLPTRGDALLAPAGFLVWAACGVGAYASARALGADRGPAGLSALAVAFTPAVFNSMTIAYVDNTVLALFLLGVPFAARFLAAPRAADAVLASAAFGLAAGVKVNACPLVAIWGAALVARTLRGDVPARGRLAALAGSLLAAAICLPPYVSAWAKTGSPLYPLPLAMAGRTLLPGNAELVDLESGALVTDEPFSIARLLHALLVSRLGVGRQHAGLGPGVVILLALGILGVAAARRRRNGWDALLFVLAAGLSFAVLVASPSVRSLWTAWAYSSPRLLTPLVAALAVAGALAPGRAAGALRVVAVAVSAALCAPLWRALDLEAVADLLPGAILLAVLVAFLWVATRSLPRRASLRAAGAALLVAASLVPLEAVRRDFRYRYYESAANEAAYDLYPLARPYVAAWPIWRHFDDGAPHAIAATAGWDGMGHNWYLYPLLGSRLQNRVAYVSPMKDGSVIDYRDEEKVAARASPTAWLGLLFESGADFVVALPPPPVEAIWMNAMPGVFESVASGVGEGGGRAYRFDAKKASEILYGGR